MLSPPPLEYLVIASAATSLLVLLALAFLRWAGRQKFLRSGAVHLAALMRLLTIVVLLLVVYPHYDAQTGPSDNTTYMNIAREQVAALWSGNYEDIKYDVGNNMMGLVASMLFLIAEPSEAILFSVYSLIGLAGCLFFISSTSTLLCRTSITPLVIGFMLCPSILVWTSIFGKDPVVFCGLGLATYCYSRYVIGKTSATFYLAFLLSMCLIISIRPHIGVAVAISLSIAEISRILSRRKYQQGNPLFIGCLAVAIVLSASLTSKITGLEEQTIDSAVDRLLLTREFTSIGGSAVDISETSGIVGVMANLPSATVRIFFRPTIWEATSVFTYISAAENTVLVMLCLLFGSRIMGALKQAVGTPLGIFAVSMIAFIIVINSSIANLGILARSKVHLIPFVFVVLCHGFATAAKSQRRPYPTQGNRHWSALKSAPQQGSLR